jgi:hypothetical protein
MYDPLHCALFLILAFVLAGLPHSLWLNNRSRSALAIPSMAVARFAGVGFLARTKHFGICRHDPGRSVGFCYRRCADFSPRGVPPATLWQLTPAGYAALGAWAGFGFMAGELPNSFVKRQLGILPGQAPASGSTRTICFLIDRIDSIVGMLVAVTLAVNLPWTTWLWVLVLGPSIHLLFSWWLFRMGVKGRAA